MAPGPQDGDSLRPVPGPRRGGRPAGRRPADRPLLGLSRTMRPARPSDGCRCALSSPLLRARRWGARLSLSVSSRWIFSSSMRKVRWLRAVDEGLGDRPVRGPAAGRFRSRARRSVAKEGRDVVGDEHQRLLAVLARRPMKVSAGVLRLGSIVSSGRLRRTEASPCSAAAGGDRDDPDVDRPGVVALMLGRWFAVAVARLRRSPAGPRSIRPDVVRRSPVLSTAGRRAFASVTLAPVPSPSANCCLNGSLA